MLTRRWQAIFHKGSPSCVCSQNIGPGLGSVLANISVQERCSVHIWFDTLLDSDFRNKAPLANLLGTLYIHM